MRFMDGMTGRVLCLRRPSPPEPSTYLLQLMGIAGRARKRRHTLFAKGA